MTTGTIRVVLLPVVLCAACGAEPTQPGGSIPPTNAWPTFDGGTVLEQVPSPPAALADGGGINTDGGAASGPIDGSTTAERDASVGLDDAAAAAEPAPMCDLASADVFQTSDAGGGGSLSMETDHFRIYAGAFADVETAANHLEAAYSCFVEFGCWRSPGLSRHGDDGPHYKMNIYGVTSLGGAAGVMGYDAPAGLSYLEVLNSSLGSPHVTVHEFGHGLTLTESGWVEQTRTGAWWETVANYVADSYLTSPFCEAARTRFGISEGKTIIDLPKVIGESYRVIVDNQNYYQAWPFLTYLTHNPDGYSGLGRIVLPTLFRSHPGNNETPLHVLGRVITPVRVQAILGRYWARMAYLDIDHPKAQQAFFDTRASLDFSTLDAVGSETYRVKAARRPRYGGANIHPLTLTGGGPVSVEITNLGNGLPESNFTATLSIRATSGVVRYVDLPGGSGQATVGSDEEASLVVVNTPDELYPFDAFDSGAPEETGLNYEAHISGAAPAY